MSVAPKAVQLAESAHLSHRVGWQREAAAELRRLHALNAQLVEALQECAGRLQIHIKHSDDLVAHMKACAALAKAEAEQ